MNINYQKTKRYHWYSENIKDLICEPHSAITQSLKMPVLNLNSRLSEKNRSISLELVNNNYFSLKKDLFLLNKYQTKMSQILTLKFKDENCFFKNCLQKISVVIQF